MVLLSQAQSDRAILAKQLGISEHQLSYITHSNSGEGLLFYFLICLPRTSRSKQTVKRKEITLPFFLFSRMFAIETHPFISDVSMAFTRYFRSCALFCALLEFLHICAPRVLLLKVAKKP